MKRDNSGTLGGEPRNIYGNGLVLGFLRRVLDGLGHRERADLARRLLRGFVAGFVLAVLVRLVLHLVVDESHGGLAVTAFALALEADPLQLAGLLL